MSMGELKTALDSYALGRFMVGAGKQVNHEELYKERLKVIALYAAAIEGKAQ